MIIYQSCLRATREIRVWRSLVSRLNGVQEAAGSNPVTRTKRPIAYAIGLFLFPVSRSGLHRKEQMKRNGTQLTSALALFSLAWYNNAKDRLEGLGMTELEMIQRAKMYMDKLAQGIDPISDQAVPNDSVLNQVRLARCFFYVSDVLGKVIANGGHVGNVSKSQSFAISPEQLAMVRLSQEPVTVSWIVDALAEAVSNPDMRKLSATVITNWLLNQGFLEKKTTADGKNNRVPTDNGFAIGLTAESRQGRDGEYTMVLYNINAQRFVLGHLMEMLSPEKAS